MPINKKQQALIWAAGFIDGEGTISMYERPGYDKIPEIFIKIQAVNTQKRALSRLYTLFGGSIQSVHKLDERNWKPSFCWSATHYIAENAIRELYPFLLLKRPQAKLALEARTYVRPAGTYYRRSESHILALSKLLKKFRKLNHKGKV